MSLLGIDIGTTGCKACAFSNNGEVLAYAYREYCMEAKGHGIYELDPEIVWGKVKEIIQQVNKNLKHDFIESLCLSVSGDEVIPMDINGNCLHHVIMSADIRGEQSNKFLIDGIGKETIYKTTGIPPHRKYGINRVLWYKNNLPELYKKTWRFLTWEDFIYYKLGIIDPVCSISSLARLMIINIKTGGPAQELLDYAKIDLEKFSPSIETGKIIEPISKKIARELMFVGEPLIIAGGFDQSFAAFGAGVYRQGDAVISTGTMESLSICNNRPFSSNQLMKGNYPCNIHVLPRTYNCTATNVCGGGMLKWLRDTICEEERQQSEKNQKNVYDLILSGLKYKPTGLLVLPHFSGSGPPSKDSDSLGAILGLSFKHKKKDIIQAVIEGVTFELMQNIENVEKGANVKIETLRAVGGGADSQYWLKLKADMIGKPIWKTAVKEAGCISGAMLCWLALSKGSGVEEAVSTFVKIDKIVEPDMVRHNQYMDLYELYKRVYPNIKEISHGLSVN